MLLRPDGDDTLCIGQASHAWISGQMARAWAEPFEPYEELCLAAEQHDIGMAEWDLTPTLNVDTGLPHSFMEMPFEVHRDLWLAAPYKLVTQSTYAAALVSMHGSRLYEMRQRTPEVEDFLGRQAELRDGLAVEISKENSDLIWQWDHMSLALILEWDDRGYGEWPFRAHSLTVHCEARRLSRRFDDEEEMRAALRATPPERLQLRVERA
jgi:Protein of unknown function (DUF3891)